MKLEKYKHSNITIKPNQMIIPVNTFEMDEEGIKEFNSIFLYIKKMGKKLNPIIRTESGGISNKTIFPAYDVRNTSTVIEITLIYKYMYRFQCRSIKQSAGIKGRQAFIKFKKLCKQKRFGSINLDDYKISNGADVKETIEMPLIKMEHQFLIDEELDNVHHIDFHNSYPAGLVNTHPEFKDVVEYLYNKRKTDPECKAILNLTIGFFQSEKCCKAQWANLSKDAIADNNKRIIDLAEKLRASGRVIISYNTDGIWYFGDIYHGENEGDKLGQWHNDHINCKFRAKSAGAYEFIEDGVYYPVVRGHTHLDDLKPRSSWQWGDIYNKDAVAVKYILTDDGIQEVIDGK